MEKLTTTYYQKHKYTNKELLELSSQMAEAEALIVDKSEKLKVMNKAARDDIGMDEDRLHNCAEKIRNGFEEKAVDCFVTYDNGEATFVAKDTGEILEQRPMTEDEQLKMTEHRVDAESVIREG